MGSTSAPGAAAGLAYDVVDVFVDPEAPGFSGNQLAVVHGAAGLPDAVMLALTREFGYSETTFPTPVDAATYDVRIFTPGGEIPFAGHPTLGTAWVLRSRGEVGPGALVQRCGAGAVGVDLGAADGDLVTLTATPRPARELPDDVVAGLLEAVGVPAGARAGRATLAGCGLDFALVPVAETAVGGAHPATGSFDPVLGGLLPAAFGGLYLYAAGPADPVDVHARMFATEIGVAEDAATGSAAAALGVHLAVTGDLPEGGRYEIRQGVEMGRPARLSGEVAATGGVPSAVRVSGLVRAVATGRVVVP